MTPPPPTPGQTLTRRAGIILASPQDKIAVCLDRMRDANVGSILITEDNRPVGILTERDVLRLWRQLMAPGGAEAAVADVCTRPVYTMTMKDFGQAAAEMVRRRIRHVPLVDDDGRVVGIISMRDVLEAHIRAGTLPALRPVAKAPAASVVPLSMLHLLTPTAQLAQICRQFLPFGWDCRLWMSLAALEAALDGDSVELGHGRSAFMLDLDGLDPAADWRPLIRRFIKRLSSREQPEIFLVSTPTHVPPQDGAALRAVAAKAHWYIYQRPLPVTALGADLARLGARSGDDVGTQT